MSIKFCIIIHILFILNVAVSSCKQESFGLKAGVAKKSLAHNSHAEDLEGVPELFDSLFSSPINEWSIVKFSFDYETVLPNSNLMGVLTVNCTIVYFDHCVSWNKCHQSCISIGASSYRWFHDACCECVGSTCLNYGLNESRCKFCPDEDDDEFNEDFDEDNSLEFEV